MSHDAKSFRVDLGLLRELGERLISRDEVAVVELVKNAYDADASRVEVSLDRDRIEVRDNGRGMDSREIGDGWLTLGTPLKRKNTRTAKGRRVLGEKGLGRLAVLRLGSLVTIHTRRADGPCYRIVMDWEHASRQLERNRFVPIEEMDLEVATVGAGNLGARKGTLIVIEKLRSTWDNRSVERLKIFLSRLVEPDVLGRDRFNIHLSCYGKDEAVEPPEITRNPHYRMEAAVADDGTVSGTVGWNIGNSRGSEPIQRPLFEKLVGADGEVRAWSKAATGGCGSFRFRLSVWDLDAAELRGQKQTLKQWGGVSLLRNGFRVVQPDVDWLGLDLRRVQNPTLRLSTNQIIGNVFISSDENPQLTDKTDREGINQNDASAVLKAAIHELMNILEKKRYALRRGKVLSRGVIFRYLDTEPLRRLAREVPAKHRRGIEQYASSLDRFRDMLDEWILGRDRMATMGLLAARLIHEVRGALAKITDNYPLVEKDLPKLEPRLRERIERMVTGGRLLHKIFEELDPFLKFRGRSRQDVVVREVVSVLEFLFGPELKKNGIKLLNSVPARIRFRANPTDFYVMLGNFLDNSIYWLVDSKARSPVVEFRARETPEAVILEVADSGPGIAEDAGAQVFDAGFTTKPQGTGLGLSIVRDVVESYGGTVEASEDEQLGGALFRVVLPLKGV